MTRQHSAELTEAAALSYAARGWPVFPLHTPNDAGRCSCRNQACTDVGKHPRTRHGFKDATTDPERIGRWWGMWPRANVGIATGAPGPTVLDVDAPSQAPAELARIPDSVPRAASSRGPHLYFRGSSRPTVGLAYGELKGLGGYVVAPPSIHATGRLYVWTCEPNGTLLLEVPDFVVPVDTPTAGCGDHRAPTERVPYHARYPYLKDFAVHLVRGAITDADTIEWHLRAEFARICEPLPEPDWRKVTKLARDAAKWRIAERERRRAA